MRPVSACGTPAAGSSSSSTAGAQSHGERHLEKPLLAIGDSRDAPRRDLAEAEDRENLRSLGQDGRHAVIGAGHTAGPALPLQDGERHMLLRRHVGKQPRHLEGCGRGRGARAPSGSCR